MGELYGGREAEIGRSLRVREYRSQEIENRQRFEEHYKDRGTSERILGCLTVRASWNTIFIISLVSCCHPLLRCHSTLRWYFFLCGQTASRCILTHRKTHAWSEDAS